VANTVKKAVATYRDNLMPDQGQRQRPGCQNHQITGKNRTKGSIETLPAIGRIKNMNLLETLLFFVIHFCSTRTQLIGNFPALGLGAATVHKSKPVNAVNAGRDGRHSPCFKFQVSRFPVEDAVFYSFSSSFVSFINVYCEIIADSIPSFHGYCWSVPRNYCQQFSFILWRLLITIFLNLDDFIGV
jgi:hypothetical protein